MQWWCEASALSSHGELCVDYIVSSSAVVVRSVGGGAWACFLELACSHNYCVSWDWHENECTLNLYLFCVLQ